MSDGPRLLKFPSVTRETVKDVLARASAANLSQVLILSYDEEGTIHYFESDEMTIANANWLLDCYKYHLQAASTKY